MPILRHLGLVFPEDDDSWSIHDQYMIGAALLVAPVVEEGATSREVYLPPGETWFHVWTGDSYEGGEYVTVDAPIGSPPVFSRGEDRAEDKKVVREKVDSVKVRAKARADLVKAKRVAEREKVVATSTECCIAATRR